MAFGALVIGFSKTGIGGLSAISVAIFASVMPTRESTAAILLLLIVGDVVAVWTYHRGADLSILRRLVPGVLPGLALGTWVLAVVDDGLLRRGIGVLLLVLALLQLVLRWRAPDRVLGTSRAAAAVAGAASGFATMTANAAGGIMTLYLVAQGVNKTRYLGTYTALFLGVNLVKVPFSVGAGLMTWDSLRLMAFFAPFVLLGTWLGRRVARRLSQTRFDQAVLVATVVSAVPLLV